MDPAGRVIAGAFAIFLVYLLSGALRSGTIFGRGVPFTITDSPAMFALTAIIRALFIVFLCFIAAGYDPVGFLKLLVAH